MSFPGSRGPPPPPLGGVPLIPGPGYPMPQPVLGLPVMGPPGVPVVGMPGGLPPGIPSAIPPPMSSQDRRPRVPYSKPPPKNINTQSSTDEKASTITVFVGNITERATDNLVRAVLAKCGYIANWKRAHGANGILQGFGFCEFSEPDAAIRAIRLLNEMEIGDKNLMVKADAKTKEMLAKYETERRAAVGNGSADDYDEMAKKVDQEVLDQIEQLLKVHAAELKQKGSSEKDKSEKDKDRGQRGNRVLIQESMDDMELDEEKKNLITREIDKFRDAYKKEEEESGSRKDDKRKRSPSPGGSRKRERERRRSRSPRPRSPRRTPERSRRSPDGRHSDRKNREQRQNSVDDDERYQKELREKAKEREREYMRMEREKRREDKNVLDESDEEELYERKRNEKRLREKEANYQDHLKQWETREKRRAKEYSKEKEREDERLVEEQKEARRLREFFEDYDDERDDLRFYSGTSLQRRMREREREIEWDLKDRQREREEFDELKKKLAQEGHPDPEGEAQRQLQPQPPQPCDHDRVDAGTDPERIDDENTPLAQKVPQRKDKNSKSHADEEERAAREQREAKEKTKEDKLRHIKTLVEKIPSNKEQLFAYDLDRTLVDDTLMERRVRPWINKKIVEYIGEEEVTLVDFICSKIIAGADAKSLLGDVSMVLDDEAENFVVKMWRLLIYEVEAKKVSLPAPGEELSRMYNNSE